MDLDVIVEIDLRAPPFRELPVLGGQANEGGAFDRLEQLGRLTPRLRMGARSCVAWPREAGRQGLGGAKTGPP